MAIADLRAAFNAGLNGKGSCTGATMGYVPEDRRTQRLTFTATVAGASHTITEDVPPGVDLASKAKEMAEAFVASLED